MQQRMLITILVVEGCLEVVGKDIPWKIAQMIELKGKVADHYDIIGGWLARQPTAKLSTGKLLGRLGPIPL